MQSEHDLREIRINFVLNELFNRPPSGSASK